MHSKSYKLGQNCCNKICTLFSRDICPYQNLHLMVKPFSPVTSALYSVYILLVSISHAKSAVYCQFSTISVRKSNVSEQCPLVLDTFRLPLKPNLAAGSATQQDVMMSISSVGASEGMASRFGRLPFPTQTAMSDSLATENYHIVS